MSALLTAGSWIFGLLPERLMIALSALLGWIWFVLFRYRRSVILANIARAFPEREERERRRLGLEACRHLVRTLFEFILSRRPAGATQLSI